MQNFFSLFFLSLILVPTGAFADSKPVVRDLGQSTTVSFDVELKVISHDDQPTTVYAKIENPYTNPLICALDLALPTRRYGNDGVFNLSQTDVLVFPKGTFDSEPFAQVYLAGLPQHADVAAVSGMILEKSASCRGWAIGQRLPRRTCMQLAPTFEQSCVAARAAGMRYIPLIRDNLHLGDCGC